MSILTNSEAMALLRLDGVITDHPQVAVLLPAVDDYIKTGTGRDWGADTTIDPVAKSVASMLLNQWHDNPSMIGKVDEMRYGISNLLSQLEAKALKLAAEEAVAT